MPDPPNASPRRGFVPRSSDQAAAYPLQAYGGYHASGGNAYAQGGYATPDQAFPHDSPSTYPSPSAQQRQQGYYSFDPYAQPAWDWTQPLDWTQLPTPYEPQGALIQERCVGSPLAPPPRRLPQRPAKCPKMKRKVDAELQTMAQQGANEPPNPTKRRAVSRASSTTSQSPAPAAVADAQPSPIANAAQIAASANRSSIQDSGEAQRRKNAAKGTGPQGREIDVSEPRRVVESSGSGDVLPAGTVFPIQIGSALFRLSGASLSSDAPSYFSHFFAEQLHDNGGRASHLRTLYIDRDPDTFRDIALHLQGYHIVPRDGEHFVKLFADAQFYSLPRLTKQLFKADIFISVGGTPFRIPRDSFSAPGDSPNYFSLGFAQWFSTPAEVFPGLDRNALLRPPSISPPSVPNKSGETFAELMKMLQGYEVEIRNETHRANLLRDARYFHLKGLEQRLVACEKTYNLTRQQNEILIRLEDIRQSGVSFTPDPPTPSGPDPPTSPRPGSVSYARPYTDDATAPHMLILETSSSESTTLHIPPSPSPTRLLTAHATFHGPTRRRMASLFNIIAAKTNLPHPQPLYPTHTHPGTAPSDPRVQVRIDGACALTLDGRDVDLGVELYNEVLPNSGSGSGSGRADLEWTVRRAQWRVRLESTRGAEEAALHVVLEPVRMDAVTCERARNAGRAFLRGG